MSLSSQLYIEFSNSKTHYIQDKLVLFHGATTLVNVAIGQNLHAVKELLDPEHSTSKIPFRNAGSCTALGNFSLPFLSRPIIRGLQLVCQSRDS